MNLLEQIRLTSKEIESQIQDYKLLNIQIRNYRMEWSTTPPIFAETFYKMIMGTHIDDKIVIPTQYEFWNQYKLDNEIWISRYINSKDQKVALKARLFRAYPSLIRDIHFAKLLQESGKFQNVEYDLIIDIKYGIDVILIYNNKRYAVRLYVDTPRAQEAKNKKQLRHKDYEDLIYIDLPLNLDSAKQVGEFKLYSEDNMIQLMSEIKRHERDSQ